jgi:polyhydroxyalkanoate synthesis regulator phasin
VAGRTELATEQLESLEDRLAQYGGLFREQAKDFVASLERSTDLDMRFLAASEEWRESLWSRRRVSEHGKLKRTYEETDPASRIRAARGTRT